MVEVYDIECLKNFFSYVGFNIETKEYSEFVIHESRDDSKALHEHLNNLHGQIGFNNLVYDAQLLEYFLWYSYDEFPNTSMLYEKSQSIIETSNSGGFPEVPEWKLSTPQMDLYKIFHFDNKAKSTS